ncbi:hypothetical protein GWI33_002145 [Rhynchophorus ferrugineus]|uniref:Uncharacterized protein n=1 Tax=Rhynchophorus ferrugineus TaxID=354439 RepID=A0A834MJR0_RHYFE|nr:hypothetical protein GWI33_002145 [Rhynchophorus ferrugineus]
MKGSNFVCAEIPTARYRSIKPRKPFRCHGRVPAADMTMSLKIGSGNLARFSALPSTSSASVTDSEHDSSAGSRKPRRIECLGLGHWLRLRLVHYTRCRSFFLSSAV